MSMDSMLVYLKVFEIWNATTLDHKKTSKYKCLKEMLEASAYTPPPQQLDAYQFKPLKFS